MKRLISICIVCLLTIGMLSSVAVSVSAGVDVTASAATVTAGQKVTITVKYSGDGKTIAGIDGTIDYNTDLFTYVSFSGDGVDVNGGAGKVRFVFEATGVTAPKSVNISFTFEAKKPGACTFTITTNECIDDDYNAITAGKKSISVSAMATTVTNKPTLSGNANLKRLVPSKGTLTPKFDPKVTDYTVTVPYDVQSVTFSADSEDPTADIAISGKSALQVGKNTRVLTVTAPNGTTKKYNLTVIRKEAPSTTSGTGDTNGTTGTTLPLPPADALDVTIDGKPMTILDTQAGADLPAGFRWGNLTVNYIEVPAAVNVNTGMTLLYLVGENGEGDGFYIYDAVDDVFTRFRPFTVAGGNYLLYDLPTDKKLSGMVWGTLEYEGGSVSAYTYHDPALSDFYVVWAAPAEGEARWYTYDKAENTLQRYYSATILNNADTTTTQKADVDADGKVEKKPKDGIASFFANHQKILLIGGIAIAGIVVIVLLFVMISSLSGRKKGKH